MSSGNIWERLLKQWATVCKLMIEGKRNPQKVADMLQSIIEEQKYELYLFGEQKTGGRETGYAIEAHLNETGLIKRALSLESPLVKGWLDNPSSYPEELKDKAVVLWGSRRTADDGRDVANLTWSGDRLVVAMSWFWLEGEWGRRDVALLASS